MKHFKPYPIYVNYNLFTEEELEASEKKWQKRYEAELAANPKLRKKIEQEREESIRKNGGYSDYRLIQKQYLGIQHDWLIDEITAQKSSPESDAYENSVIKVLAVINTTSIGKLLLSSMKLNQKVWIAPWENRCVDNGLGGKNCASNVAVTGFKPIVKQDGGGVRVHYDPVDPNSADNYYSACDVLFHELVHAYRAERWTRRRYRSSPLREYETEEEFIAVYMTNVFRASYGNVTFYRAHKNATLLTQEQSYEYLSSDSEAFRALEYFVKNDELAGQVAKMAYPFFNPWRDFSQLRQRFWKDYARFGSKSSPFIDL